MSSCSPGIVTRSLAAWRKLQQTLDQPVWRAAAFNLALIALWYTLSTLLGIYNKTLLGRDHGLLGRGAFPAPLFMSAVQFLLQFLLARLVFMCKLVDRRTDDGLDWPSYWKIVVPNGIITGLDIGFSNKSLVYITMSFYTMCKSTVPIFLLACAFIWRIERPSWELAGVVSVITVGLVLLVEGEAEFDLLGFILVMSASAMSGLRFTLTQLSLHGHSGSASLGGPLEVLELLTPIMSISTFVLSVFWEKLWSVLPGSPYLSTPQQALSTVAVVGVGALLAFLMVWTEYKVIKETSALTFMIAGTCKEVVTVVVAVLVFGDHFGAVNGVGLAIVILGVVLFNVHKYQRMAAAGGHHALAAAKDDEQELVPLMVVASSSNGGGAGGPHHHSPRGLLVDKRSDSGAAGGGASAGGAASVAAGGELALRVNAPSHLLVLGGNGALSPSSAAPGRGDPTDRSQSGAPQEPVPAAPSGAARPHHARPAAQGSPMGPVSSAKAAISAAVVNGTRRLLSSPSSQHPD